ncbi:hypothetical protein Tco_1327167 [Tanacetum coccineum]
MHRVRGDGVTGIKRRHRDLSDDGVRKTSQTASGSGPNLKRSKNHLHLVSKFINPSPDTETPSFDTTIPQPPIPIIQPLQQTPDSITTTTILTMTVPNIPNFASLFQFEQRVFAEVVSLILGIVDNYLASKMKETIGVAVQLQINKLIEEAQADNQEFLNQVDSTMKKIIKEQTSYVVVASLLEFELKKIFFHKIESNKSIDIGRDAQDKDEEPFAGSNRGSKRRRSCKEAESSKEATYKESKSTGSSKGATRSQPKSLSKSAHAEEHGQKVDDLEDQSH